MISNKFGILDDNRPGLDGLVRVSFDEHADDLIMDHEQLKPQKASFQNTAFACSLN